MMTSNQRSVTVNRLQLIEKLKSNLEVHKQEYQEAVEGYKIKLKHDLSQAMDQLILNWDRPENLKAVSVKFAFPTSFEKEYLDAIEMLEWSVNEVIELDQHLFKQYVQNEWAWMGGFKAAASQYKSFL